MSAEFQQPDASPEAIRDAFARQGYAIVPGLLPEAMLDFLWSYVHTKFASFGLLKGDDQVPNTPCGAGDGTFDGLLEYLRPKVEEYSGVSLYPTYSFFRLYKHGDVLKRHRDRHACEFSISLNIRQVPADPWPIYVEGKNGPYGAALMPGDALLYRGIDLYHWRDAYAGSRMLQVFLHYVNKNGPHADQKFDKRKTLMRPDATRSQAV